MRRDLLFIGGSILVAIVAAILLIGSILMNSPSTGQTHGSQSQTPADNKPARIVLRDNVTPEMLYAPLNVSKLAQPYPYEMRKDPMSVEEAADCVRSFVNNSSLDITYRGNSSTSFGIVYDMRSGQNFFSVNPMTGQVFIAFTNDHPGLCVLIGRDEAKSIATEYLRDHYKDFVSMTLTDSRFEDPGNGGKDYEFYWHEYIDGVQTLNNANVMVDAETGKVWYYGGLDFPVPQLLNSTISREQAINIALSRMGKFSAGDLRAYLAGNRTFNMTIIDETSAPVENYNATVTNITASQQFVLDGKFAQHQAWNIVIDETRPAVIHEVGGKERQIEDGHRWWINVDAGTGDVIDMDHCF